MTILKSIADLFYPIAYTSATVQDANIENALRDLYNVTIETKKSSEILNSVINSKRSGKR